MSTFAVRSASLEGQQHVDGYAFPLVLAADTRDAELRDAVSWVQTHLRTLRAQLEQHGAILFRSFPVHNADDFDTIVRAFDTPNFPYDESLSNAVRINRTERVFTANEAPPDVSIYLHHEMAQTPLYPSQLFFFCEQPAERGGATPICRSDALWQKLRQEVEPFAAACAERGLRYTTVMPAEADLASGMGRSWQDTLRATTRQEAEEQLGRLGYTWEWGEDDSLVATTPTLPAVKTLANGRQSFFNQLIAASQGWKDRRNDSGKAITHGDGSPLDRDAVARVVELAEQLSFDIPWEAGDIAWLDNYAVMHGRRSFTGTRKVLASLVASH